MEEREVSGALVGRSELRYVSVRETSPSRRVKKAARSSSRSLRLNFSWKGREKLD